MSTEVMSHVGPPVTGAGQMSPDLDIAERPGSGVSHVVNGPLCRNKDQKWLTLSLRHH